MDDLLQEFILETRDTLEALSSELVAWEANPADHERLDSIFRFFHTIKGSCGFLNLPRFERISHAAEDVLSQLRDGSRQVDSHLVGAILAIVDRIAELTRAMETGDPIPDGTDYELIAALSADYVVTEATVEPYYSAAEPAHAPATAAAGLRSIRIPLELLDRVMNGVSDLVLARNEVARHIRENAHDVALDNAFQRLSGCIADIRDSIGQTRMQRIDRVFSPLARLVRDLNQELGKSVTLGTSGAEVELDRELIEMIRDPLVHIIRNSIDHGIETPEQRRAAGKSPTGKLNVSARQSGNQIIIDVADDGQGIDLDRLAAKAVASRLVKSSDIARMSEKAKLELIFAPGLSTASAITAISGRGVGMDVVRSNIEKIGGSVELDNRPGEGLKVSIRVPLTLTIIACLTVQAGQENYALPRASIKEILHSSSPQVQLQQLGGSEIAFIRGQCMPLVRLDDVLAIASADSTADLDRTIICIHASSDIFYALSVASVLDHEELVIRPGVPVVMATGLYAGTTLPDNGRPMLMLDPVGIATQARISDIELLQDHVDEDDSGFDAERVSALLFRDFSDNVRAIPLAALERLEEVSRDQINLVAGEYRVTFDDRTIPVFGFDMLPDVDTIKLMHLNDGATRLFYAIEQVYDIFALRKDVQPLRSAGLIAGLTMVDGKPVELVDVHWLFTQYAGLGQRDVGARPVCFVAEGDDHWTKSILVPLLQATGYDVRFDGAESADLVIQTAINPKQGAQSANTLLLRDDAATVPSGVASIYRYDRAALIDALQNGLKTRKSA